MLNLPANNPVALPSLMVKLFISLFVYSFNINQTEKLGVKVPESFFLCLLLNGVRCHFYFCIVCLYVYFFIYLYHDMVRGLYFVGAGFLCRLMNNPVWIHVHSLLFKNVCFSSEVPHQLQTLHCC